jgi:hypothetical protein
VAGRTFEAKLDKHGKWIEIHTHTAGDIKLDIAQPELTPNVPTQAVR